MNISHNRETAFILQLLESERGRKQRPDRKKEVENLIEYISNANIDANFGYSSLSYEQWDDFINFPEVFKRIQNDLKGNTEFEQFQKDTKVEINYENIFSIPITKNIEEKISKIQDILFEIKIYTEATNNLNQLRPKENIDFGMKVTERNKNVLEELATTSKNLQKLAEHLIKNSIV